MKQKKYPCKLIKPEVRNNLWYYIHHKIDNYYIVLCNTNIDGFMNKGIKESVSDKSTIDWKVLIFMNKILSDLFWSRFIIFDNLNRIPRWSLQNL